MQRNTGGCPGAPAFCNASSADGSGALLDALDGRLSRLGRFGSTAALTAMAVVAAVPLHFLVRCAEGLPVQPIAMVNLAVEIALVAAPIIFYARDVIAQLKTSRADMRRDVPPAGHLGGAGRAGQPRQVRLPGQYEP